MRIGTGASCGPVGGFGGGGPLETSMWTRCGRVVGAALLEWPRNGSHTSTPAVARNASTTRPISRRRTAERLAALSRKSSRRKAALNGWRSSSAYVFEAWPRSSAVIVWLTTIGHSQSVVDPRGWAQNQG